MKRVVILTGSELRHVYFRKAVGLAPGIEVIRTYAEGQEKSLRAQLEGRWEDQAAEDIEFRHLEARERSEEDFFAPFVALAPDRASPLAINKGEINDPRHADDITGLAPDLLIAYGCSIIREPLLSAFAGRFLNVHLGLSPYYRGSGTNFWPLVNGEPEYVGATFMHIDAGIDTGRIIHQIRARIFPGDTPHQIGNRLIADMAPVYAALIRRFDDLAEMAPIPVPVDARVYRNRDFSATATRALYGAFDDGLVATYLGEQEIRCAKVKIAVNPVLDEETQS